MDEVLEQLQSTVINSEHDHNKTNFDGLYKNWGKLGHQEQRRKDILDVQKSNRNTKLDTFRGILEIVNAVEERETVFQHKPHTRYRPNIYVAGFTKASVNYRDVLMMSEWLIEKPSDFEENWFIVPCPKGVRTLVVASQGNTKCYNKYGLFKMAARTALPGGSRNDHNFRNHCVVLDCFYVEEQNKMFILDLLAWNNQPMTDGEAEFRHYWLKTQMDEIPDVKTISKKNKLIFEILPKVNCDKESLNIFMSKCPHFENFTPNLDGLLFYHKKAHYVSGVTPLVGWLYPFMVNEVLGSDILVSKAYLIEKPETYVNQAQYIQEFEKKNAKKIPKFMRGRNAMDTATDEKDKENIQNSQIDPKQTKQSSNKDAEMTEGDIAEEKQNDSVEVTNGSEEKSEIMVAD